MKSFGPRADRCLSGITRGGGDHPTLCTCSSSCGVSC